MNIFLTGEIKVGKSTVIQRVLKELNLVPGGFRTIAGNFASDASSDIFIVKTDEANPVCSETNKVAHRLGKGIYQAFPDVFDQIGVRILNDAQNYPLIVMDELGFMESQAFLFQEAIMKTLTKDIPTLGVIKLSKTPFLEQIRNFPGVQVIPVDENNRNEIFHQIVTLIKP